MAPRKCGVLYIVVSRTRTFSGCMRWRLAKCHCSLQWQLRLSISPGPMTRTTEGSVPLSVLNSVVCLSILKTHSDFYILLLLIIFAQGAHMRSLLRIAGMALFLCSFLVATRSAVAEQFLSETNATLILASVSGGACVASEKNAVIARSRSCTGSDIGIRRSSERLAAVSCGSNQWCCRHDFSNGSCVRCCSK